MGCYIYPPPGVCPGVTLTGRPSAPWDPPTRFKRWSSDAFGSSQGELPCFSSSYCTTFHVSVCVHYEYTLKIHILTLYLVFDIAFMQYSVRFLTTLVSLAPEAPTLLCAFPRSPVRCVLAFRNPHSLLFRSVRSIRTEYLVSSQRRYYSYRQCQYLTKNVHPLI